MLLFNVNILKDIEKYKNKGKEGVISLEKAVEKSKLSESEFIKRMCAVE